MTRLWMLSPEQIAEIQQAWPAARGQALATVLNVVQFPSAPRVLRVGQQIFHRDHVFRANGTTKFWDGTDGHVLISDTAQAFITTQEDV